MSSSLPSQRVKNVTITLTIFLTLYFLCCKLVIAMGPILNDQTYDNLKISIKIFRNQALAMDTHISLE